MARANGSTVGVMDTTSSAPTKTKSTAPKGRHAGPWGASFDGTLADGKTRAKGLTFERRWTTPGIHPYDEINWEMRTAGISSETGKSVFEQKDVEVPDFWSQLATNVVVSKYFRGHLGTPERETSVKQLIDRVVDTIAAWAETQHYFATGEDLATFKAELTHLLVHQKMAFNSPVWFNVGIEKQPQCSACFINSVQDTMSSIMDLAKTEAMLFKFGSGAGSNLSTIRSAREKMTGGGTASGPVSFMKGYDAFAGVVKSGGKTRRAAKMVILDAGHPDILDFVDSKLNEEKKAWALIEQGYDASFTGEAYGSVFFQNANHSVRVTDAFMQAVEKDQEWTTHAVVDGAPMDTYRAKDIFRRMAEAAWVCGDPGIQYDTTINDWHTSANTDRIHASNPCSEYMFLNDTACNLASLNLMKFVDADGEFDPEAYRFAAKVTLTAQEILVDNASYPTPMIEENSHKFRPLGLGYANLGALLMSRGLAYDSDEGRNFAAALTAIMHGEAYKQSAIIARDHGGPFQQYEVNEQPFLRVIGKHRDAAYRIKVDGVPKDLVRHAHQVYDEALELGKEYGYRNAQVTVLAPTGTIAFMMDCDTTGVEPDIALIKYKKLVGEGFLKIVNQTVPAALKKLGYTADQASEILDYLTERETIEGAPHIKDEHLSVFDCAFKPANGTRSIHYMGHVRMMGAIQPFISRRDQQDRQHARGRHGRGDRDGLPRGLEAGPQGHRHLPRQQQALAAAHDLQGLGQHGDRYAGRGRSQEAAGQGPGRGGAPPSPASAVRADGGHPQVRHRRPRGLHHRRALSRWAARRDLPEDGQGGLDRLRPHGLVRDDRVRGAPVRRAAQGPGQQVRPRPVRAERLHRQPGDPDRQVDRGLHLPVAGIAVPRHGCQGRVGSHRSVGRSEDVPANPFAAGIGGPCGRGGTPPRPPLPLRQKLTAARRRPRHAGPDARHRRMRPPRPRRSRPSQLLGRSWRSWRPTVMPMVTRPTGTGRPRRAMGMAVPAP